MQAFSSSLFAVIRARRSHGMGYLDKPVEREKLEQILEAAHWAPSHGRTEPWRFAVFTGEARKKLGEAFAESYALSVSGADFRPERYTAQLERVWRAPVWIGLGLEPSGRFPEWVVRRRYSPPERSVTALGKDGPGYPVFGGSR